jgi:hypothetical protein
MDTNDTPEEAADTRELGQSPLADRVAPDPANSPAVIVIVGFLGRSVSDDRWRVYQTPRLDEYLEVLEEDIVHREPLPAGDSSIGGSVLWVKASARLMHTRVLRHEAQAGFLRGEIRAPGTGSLEITDVLGPVAVYYPRTYQAICSILTYHPDRCWLRAFPG